MPIETEELKPGTLSKETKESLSSLWKLYFKRGANPRAELVFELRLPKEDAIKRGREFCLRMNYKFIHVEPFFVDLEATEKEFLGRG